MLMKRKVRIGILAMLMILLAACSANAPQELQSNPEPQVEQQGAPMQAPASEGETPIESEAQVATEAEIRAPRQELEATDPATVVLASGQHQIVEFFAFW